MSLNLTPKRERYFVSLSESLFDFFAVRETANSFFAASAAVSEARQTAATWAEAILLDGLEQHRLRSWKDWCLLEREQNSVWADPLFVDVEKGDYRLKPDSPALARGFRPLDVSKAGVEGR